MSNITGVVRGTAANPSVGDNNTTAPTSSTLVGGIDSSGNLQGVLVDSNGKLIVNDGLTGNQSLKVLFNEVSSVSVGVETVVQTYTVPVGVTSYLLSIAASGGNRAQFMVYNNNVLFDKQYTNVTQQNAPFDYKTGINAKPGMVLSAGNVLKITTLNSGMDSVSFNAKFIILEVS